MTSKRANIFTSIRMRNLKRTSLVGLKQIFTAAWSLLIKTYCSVFGRRWNTVLRCDVSLGAYPNHVQVYEIINEVLIPLNDSLKYWYNICSSISLFIFICLGCIFTKLLYQQILGSIVTTKIYYWSGKHIQPIRFHLKHKAIWGTFILHKTA